QNGGHIKHANYGEFMFIDGSNLNKEEQSEFSNFAILSQLVDKFGNPYDYNWIKKNIITHYADLNSKYRGKPILQSYIDFKNKKLTSSSIEHLNRIDSKIYEIGDLTGLIPDKEQHEGFCYFLETLIKEFCRISQIRDPLTEILPQISVVGLELENIWDEMELNCNMDTSIPSLFICGDSSGKAHGILQACIGGIAAAKGIMKKT
ncbi:MAG: hypothetical protein Q8909_15250, partial [Bacteroidota bacterium]|nr:hypothetical protein [Bacteroidota bacterium]